MVNQNKKEHNCCGCGACEVICPKKCIAMTPNEEGFLYPEVSNEQCISCGLCLKVCPSINSLQKVDWKKRENPQTYACMNRCEDIRVKSSSGGIFTLLANYAIDQGGVVFGASFDRNFVVKHIAVESKKEVYKLRGAKYVQSELGNCFEMVEQYLQCNRLVLFSGTPCQIQALQKYIKLKKSNSDNLYTVDVICHGVPSPLVWERYVQALETKYAGKRSSEKEPQFRAKNTGWEEYSVQIPFENNFEYTNLKSEDSYMKCFLEDINLRQSCYQCACKPSESDITLADFWGIKKVNPQLYDNKGTSMVLVHTRKGEAVFKHFSNDVISEPINFYHAIQYNTSYHQSAKLPRKRKIFYQRIEDEDILRVMSEMTRNTPIKLLFDWFHKISRFVTRRITNLFTILCKSKKPTENRSRVNAG